MRRLGRKKATPQNWLLSIEKILEALEYEEVVPTPWLLDEAVLDKFNINLLIHGDDNSNLIPKDRLKVLPRTSGVSSSELRVAASNSINELNNQKLMLTLVQLLFYTKTLWV